MIDTTTCDRLADALSYPVGDFAATVAACRSAVAIGVPAAADDVKAFERAVASMTIGGLQELYTSTFDLDPRITLDVGWHVFGESHDRGAFLASMRASLRAAGVAETSELPDHLPHFLRLIGRSTPQRAGEFSALAGVALERVIPILEAGNNPYAFLLRAVRATINMEAPPPAGPTSTSGDAARAASTSGDAAGPTLTSGDAARAASTSGDAAGPTLTSRDTVSPTFRSGGAVGPTFRSGDHED